MTNSTMDESNFNISGIEIMSSNLSMRTPSIALVESEANRNKNKKQKDKESENDVSLDHGTNSTIMSTPLKASKPLNSPSKLVRRRKLPLEMLNDPLYIKFQEYKLHKRRISQLETNKI